MKKNYPYYNTKNKKSNPVTVTNWKHSSLAGLMRLLGDRVNWFYYLNSYLE